MREFSKYTMSLKGEGHSKKRISFVNVKKPCIKFATTKVSASKVQDFVVNSSPNSNIVAAILYSAQ